MGIGVGGPARTRYDRVRPKVRSTSLAREVERRTWSSWTVCSALKSVLMPVIMVELARSRSRSMSVGFDDARATRGMIKGANRRIMTNNDQEARSRDSSQRDPPAFVRPISRPIKLLGSR